MRRLVLIGLLAGALAVPATATAAQPVSGQARISQVGTDGDATRAPDDPGAAFDPVTGQALVVWSADALADNKFEVFGRFVDADGALVGGAFLIGIAGGPADAYRAVNARVAYNSARNEFFVVWSSEEPPTVGDFEIRGQRVSPTGELIGGSNRLSDMGVGSAAFNASQPQVAYNSMRDEYIVVWHGVDDATPTRNDIFARRVSGAGVAQGGDVRISYTRNKAAWPTVAYNSQANEYMIAFIGNDIPIDASGADPQRPFVQRLTADVVPVGPNQQIMQIDDHKPAIVYNPALNQYLVAAPAIVGGDTEIYVRRLDATGAPTGGPEARISHMGPDGAPAYGSGVDSAVGWSPASGEYLVTWHGDTTSFGLVNDEFEVFGQALDANAVETGADDFPISSMGPDGTPQYGVGNFQFTGPLAYAPAANRFLVVWNGDDGPPLADDEVEVYGRMVAPAPAAPPPPPPALRKVMPNFTPLFATRARGTKGVRGSLYGISGLGSLPYGSVVSIRCETRCSLKQRSFTVRPRGKLKRTSLTLRKPVGLSSRSRVRVTARHSGYISRYIRFRFVRKNLGVIARRVGSGCQTRDKKPRKTPCS